MGCSLRKLYWLLVLSRLLTSIALCVFFTKLSVRMINSYGSDAITKKSRSAIIETKLAGISDNDLVQLFEVQSVTNINFLIANRI